LFLIYSLLLFAWSVAASQVILQGASYKISIELYFKEIGQSGIGLTDIIHNELHVTVGYQHRVLQHILVQQD